MRPVLAERRAGQQSASSTTMAHGPGRPAARAARSGIGVCCRQMKRRHGRADFGREPGPARSDEDQGHPRRRQARARARPGPYSARNGAARSPARPAFEPHLTEFVAADAGEEARAVAGQLPCLLEGDGAGQRVHPEGPNGRGYASFPPARALRGSRPHPAAARTAARPGAGLPRAGGSPGHWAWRPGSPGN